MRATQRMSFNLTFDGTLDRIGGLQYLSGTNVVAGGVRNQFVAGNRELTDRTRLLVGGPNLRYRALSSKQATLDFSTGFEVLNLQFRSMDKTFQSSGSISTTRREEKYFGYGPRFGLSASFKPTERLGFSAEGFYTTFLDLKGSRERTTSGGTDFPTEGHAFRFDLGTYYELRKGLSLGAGYRGYLLTIGQSKTKNISGEDVNMGEENIWTDLFYGYLGISF